MKLKLLKPLESILGIDASLTHTGLVVLDTTGKILHSCTIIPKTKGVQRLVDIAQALKEVFYAHTPRLIVMEGYGYSKFQGNLMGLGELGGVIKYVLHPRNIYIVAPMTLKKFATGSGKGDKNQIMLKVYKKYKVDFKDDDQTDAFVLAQIGKLIWHQHTYKTLPTETPQYER
jgi:crossover junction endodeoxyribonuclease RuvC